MSINESMEMYLETVYLLEQEHGHAHGVEVAKRLGVSKPSVSKAMSYLKTKGYINKESYGSITLTEKGQELSRNLYLNHSRIAKFLEDTLKLSPDDASTNACKMEHILSDSMLDAIEMYLIENHIEV